MRKKTELFFRMDPTTIPWKKTDPGYSDFWTKEREKVERGITIDGYYMSGWLYWHINHWKLTSDKQTEWGDIIPETITPKLRDNEIILNEEIAEAERSRRGIVVMGLRQFSKTATQSSYAARASVIYKGSQNLLMGTSSDDLNNLTQYIDFGLLNCTEYFRVPRISRDWGAERVLLGVKKKSGDNVVHSQFVIRNTGGGKKTEKGAGVSNLKSNIWDEIGKDDFLQALIGTKPAMLSEFGWRCIPFAMGCVCAGTKVWDNNGNLINIEDLDPKNGILGFKDGVISKEEITYWQPPKETDCYRLETNKGTILECSWDHPILVKNRNKRETIIIDNKKHSRRKIEFKETNLLVPGDTIAMIDEVPIFSNVEMWEPRLVGWLIGDGSYGKDKTPILSNCESEIYSYIESNLKYSIEKEYLTKDGKSYKEIRLQGICGKLRSIGIYGQTRSNKTLPLNIHSFSKNTICELLGGLYDTDGTIYYPTNNNKSSEKISLTAAHKSILDEVKLLLIKLGIHSHIYYSKPRNRERRIKDNGHFTLDITDRDSFIKFYENIKLFVKHKQDKLTLIYNKVKLRSRGADKYAKGLRFERIIKIELIGKKPVYNLTAGTSNTYIANGIVTHNTGGNVEKARDAKELFYNPQAHNFISHLQQDGRVTGLFLPGTLRQDCKYESTLAKYLIDSGILTSIGMDSELWEIPILVSDKEKAKKLILEELASFKESNDLASYNRWKAYYPLEVDDVFLSESHNNFPIEACKARKKWLELNSNPEKIEFYRNEKNKVEWKFSDEKPINKFPVSSNDVKNMRTPPVLIFEHPQLNVPFGTYCIGIDPYNEDESSDKINSLGSITVRKRFFSPHGTYQNKIVATWAGRCKSVAHFHQLCVDIAEYYNAIEGVLPENEDKTLIQYFFMKRKGHFLAQSMDLAREINQNTKSKRAVGLSAATPNQRHYMALLTEDANREEEIVYEDGTFDSHLGVDEIDDPMLLEEMIQYRGKEVASKGVHDGNFDRIISAGHAITLAKYYDVKYPLEGWVPPKSDNTSKEKKTIQTFFGEIRPKNMSPFGTISKDKPRRPRPGFI